MRASPETAASAPPQTRRIAQTPAAFDTIASGAPRAGTALSPRMLTWDGPGALADALHKAGEPAPPGHRGHGPSLPLDADGETTEWVVEAGDRRRSGLL